MTAAPDSGSGSGSGWFGRPATWKAVLFIIAYLVFYLLVGQLTGRLLADRIDDDNIVASASSIVFGSRCPLPSAALLFSPSSSGSAGCATSSDASPFGAVGGCGSVLCSSSGPSWRT